MDDPRAALIALLPTFCTILSSMAVMVPTLGGPATRSVASYRIFHFSMDLNSSVGSKGIEAPADQSDTCLSSTISPRMDAGDYNEVSPGSTLLPCGRGRGKKP